MLRGNTLLSMIQRISGSLERATLQGNKFNGIGQLIKLLPDGKLPMLDGSNLTNITSTPQFVTFIAQQGIDIYDVVTSNGLVASSGNIVHRNKIIGIANIATPDRFSGTVINTGLMFNPLWTWIPGDRIYLNNSTLSTITPTTGFLQFIGTAVAGDKIDIQLGPAILL